MSKPAKIRRKVYQFLCAYKQENDGNAPSYLEITRYFGWRSLNNAWTHVEGLARDGLIKFDEKRRIVIIDGEYLPPNSFP